MAERNALRRCLARALHELYISFLRNRPFGIQEKKEKHCRAEDPCYRFRARYAGRFDIIEIDSKSTREEKRVNCI
jgi:hypothetical protein